MFAVFDCSGVPYHSWILENSVCWPSSWQRVSLIPASSVHCIRFTPPTPLGTSVVDGPLLQLRQMLKMSSPNLAPRRWSTSLFRLFLYTLKSEFLLVHVTGPVWTHWPLFYYTVTYHYIRLIVPPPPPSRSRTVSWAAWWTGSSLVVWSIAPHQPGQGGLSTLTCNTCSNSSSELM